MKNVSYLFWGKVKKGKGRGKDLGFPTANIALHKEISEGVYVSQTKVKGTWHPSLTFIGAAKTFGEKEVQAETYLLSFNTSIYGNTISIKLLKKLRGNKKFSTGSELVKQMKEDEKEARKYFSQREGV